VEKLIVAKLVKKFLAFCGTGKYINVFTRLPYRSHPEPD
jgi:hypothetical protein